jgi:hypothetical protein
VRLAIDRQTGGSQNGQPSVRPDRIGSTIELKPTGESALHGINQAIAPLSPLLTTAPSRSHAAAAKVASRPGPP